MFDAYIKRLKRIQFLLGNDKIDYFDSLPFNRPFLDPTVVMEELAS